MMPTFIATRGDPPADCKTVVISRALWRQPGGAVIDAARSRISIGRGGAPVSSAMLCRRRPVRRVETALPFVRHVATPRQEDIEADQ
jgi:hypothetical protein